MLLKFSLQSTFSTLFFKYSNSDCSVYESQSKTVEELILFEVKLLIQKSRVKLEGKTVSNTY